MFFFAFQISDKTIKILMFQRLISSDRLKKNTRHFGFLSFYQLIINNNLEFSLRVK